MSSFRYSFLVGEEGTKERKCLPGVECPLGFALNSYGSNTTDCIPDVCIKGSPFCDTGSVYRFCEDGYTANWDLTCVPVECNNRILNTDVSYCTCADGVQDNGRVLESKCRCFTGRVVYLPTNQLTMTCLTMYGRPVKTNQSVNLIQHIAGGANFVARKFVVRNFVVGNFVVLTNREISSSEISLSEISSY